MNVSLLNKNMNNEIFWTAEYLWLIDLLVLSVSVWWSWPRTSCGSWWSWSSGWSVMENWVWRGSCERTSWIKWNRRDSCDTCACWNLSPHGASQPGKGQISGVIGTVLICAGLSVCLIGSFSTGPARCMISAVMRSPISWRCWTQNCFTRLR